MANGTGGARAVAAVGFPKAAAIMYHDVVAGEPGGSGFPGGGADLYKLTVEAFRRHLEAISRAAGPTAVVLASQDHEPGAPAPVFLTFDDGGESARSVIAGMLEEFGWRGHFFVTSRFVGRPGFLDARQIRELRARGHLIGSHSATHPTRMASLSRAQLLREWGESVERLSDIAGTRVTVASLPGGYYSRTVAETAAENGIRILFTSEPTVRTRMVAGCLTIGRYVVRRGTPPAAAAGFAGGRRLPRWKQAALWQMKKAVKAAGGSVYLTARDFILAGLR